MIGKILILVVLAGIIASLGSGLFYMVRDDGSSNKMVKALTIRISLSVLLFVVLIGAYFAGLIEPHGIVPPQ